MDQVERIEAVKPEIRRIPLREFSPTKVQEFLPGWKVDMGHQGFGWVLRRTIDNVEWKLMIHQRGRYVQCYALMNRGSKPAVEIGGVDEVELNHRDRTLSFHSKNGRYDISGEGLTHRVRHAHNESDVSARIILGKPQ